MAARRRKKSQTANYLIGTDPEDLSKDSDHIVAKVRALDQIIVAGNRHAATVRHCVDPVTA
jgi:hypothetical protein